MPQFDTRRPQEPDEPNGFRTLDARKRRILSIANNLRSLLFANWLRSALVGVGILFFAVVVIPGGLLIYQTIGVGDRLSQFLAYIQTDHPETVTCNEEYLMQGAACIAPSAGYASTVCEAETRAQVEKQGYCRKGERDLYGVDAYYHIEGEKEVTCDPFVLVKLGECQAPSLRNAVEFCRAEIRAEVDDETFCYRSH